MQPHTWLDSLQVGDELRIYSCPLGRVVRKKADGSEEEAFLAGFATLADGLGIDRTVDILNMGDRAYLLLLDPPGGRITYFDDDGNTYEYDDDVLRENPERFHARFLVATKPPLATRAY